MNLPTPYCTRAQAGEYLGWSVDTVDRCLVPFQAVRPARGNVVRKREYPPVRYRKLFNGDVRIVTDDVLAILPPPESQPRMDTDAHGLENRRTMTLTV